MMRARGPVALAVAALVLSWTWSGVRAQPSSVATGGAPVPTVVLIGPSEGWNAAQLAADRLIATAWQQLGVQVDLETAPEWGTFTSMLKSRPWQAAAASYLGIQDRIDPKLLLANPLLCHLPSNFGDYCNPAYDALVAQSSRELDPVKRRQLVFQAQKLLAKDLPLLVEFYPNDEGIYGRSKVSGLVPAVGAGIFNFWTFIDARPSEGDTLKAGMLPEARSTNPFTLLSYNTTVEAIRLIYDTLTRLDPRGQVIAWAATSWQVKDEKTIIVRLRDHLRFSDGQPLTSADVAWTFMAFKDAKTPYYINALAPIEAVDTPDPQTAIFHLSTPEASLFNLAFSSVPILPKHVWEKTARPADVSTPDMTGSGSYRFVSFDPTGETVLERNPEHFHAPKARRLILVAYTNAQTFFLALQNGDIAFGANNLINPSMVEQAKTMAHLGIISRPGLTVRWLTFNLRPGSPFADYPFRLALSRAVDYQTIVRDVLKGTGSAGAGIIAPANQLWHDPSARFPAFNLDEARATLKAAGYTWDPQGHLHYPADYHPQVLPP